MTPMWNKKCIELPTDLKMCRDIGIQFCIGKYTCTDVKVIVNFNEKAMQIS